MTAADVPIAGEHLTAVSLGGFIYAIGGRNGGSTGVNQRYDPTNDEWTMMEPMPTARAAPAAAAFGSKIYVAGGETPRLFEEHEVYDTRTDTWDVAPVMPVARHGLAAVTLDDRILFPGGAIVQGFGAVAIVDSFVPVVSTSVPTVSGWGMTALMLLILTIATIILSHSAPAKRGFSARVAMATHSKSGSEATRKSPQQG